MEVMPRKRVGVTLPEPLIEWIDKQVKARKYASRSHAIEVAVLKLKEKKE